MKKYRDNQSRDEIDELYRRINSLSQRLDSVDNQLAMAGADSAWIQPTLYDGSQPDSPTDTVAYRLKSNGYPTLRGHPDITGVAPGDPIYTIPTGPSSMTIPGDTYHMGVTIDGGTPTPAVGKIDSASGEVSYTPLTPSATIPYAYIEWIGGYNINVDTTYNLSPGVGNDLGDLESWSTAGNGYHSDPNQIISDPLNGRIQVYVDPGGPVRRGLYVAHLVVNFGENWDNGDLYCDVNWQAGTSMNLQGWQTQTGYAKTQGASHLLTLNEMVSMTSFVIVSTTSVSNCYVTGALLHRGGGGGARNLDQVSLTVARLSDYPVSTGEFTP
jgi:hypothetical protein